MLSTVLYYELAMKVPIPVGITVYLLTWGLGHLRCLVVCIFRRVSPFFTKCFVIITARAAMHPFATVKGSFHIHLNLYVG